jgi:hypothetical protein
VLFVVLGICSKRASDSIAQAELWVDNESIWAVGERLVRLVRKHHSYKNVVISNALDQVFQDLVKKCKPRPDAHMF